eukprot:746816-Hanusia_phi.AAC.3
MEIVERVQRSNQELLSLISSIPRHRQGSEVCPSSPPNILILRVALAPQREALERSRQTISALQVEISSLKNLLKQTDARQEAENAQILLQKERFQETEKQLSESQAEIRELKKNLKNAEEEVKTANSKARSSPEKDSNLSERCMEAEAKVNALIDEIEASSAKQEKDARIIWRLARRCKDILHKSRMILGCKVTVEQPGLSTLFDIWAQHMKVRSKVKFGKFRILNRFKFKVYFYGPNSISTSNVSDSRSSVPGMVAIYQCAEIVKHENDLSSSPSKSLTLSNSPSLSHKGSDSDGRRLRIENSTNPANTLELLKGAYHTNRLTIATPREQGGQDNSKSMFSNERSMQSKGDVSPGKTDDGPLDWIFKYLGENEQNQRAANSFSGSSNDRNEKDIQNPSRFKKINSLETPAKAMVIPDHNVFIEAELGLHVNNIVGARESPHKNALNISNSEIVAVGNQSHQLTVHELSVDWEKKSFTERQSESENKFTPRGEPPVHNAYVKPPHDLDRIKSQQVYKHCLNDLTMTLSPGACCSDISTKSAAQRMEKVLRRGQPDAVDVMNAL